VTLEAILLQHYRPAGLMGAENVRVELQRDLKKHARLTAVLYALLVVVALTAFVFAVWSAALGCTTGVGRTKVAASGISVVAAMEFMRRTARQWSQTNLLITLVPRMTEAQVQVLIGKLVEGDQPQAAGR
jgi:hypothetical protein